MTTLTRLLRDEHKAIKNRLDQFDLATSRLHECPSSENLSQIETQLFALNKLVSGDHHYKEEQLLFPAMFASGKVSQGGPRCSYFMGLRLLRTQLGPVDEEVRSPLEKTCLSIPIEEHRETSETFETAKELIQNLKQKSDSQIILRLFDVLSHYQTTLRHHIEKEDTCLFILADQILDLDEQQKLILKLQNEDVHRGKR